MRKKVKIIIIGAIAAGTSAAAKIRRENKEAEIVLYEKDRYISYGTCGLPYFISGEIEKIENLIVNTAENFEKMFNLKVNVLHEVTGIEPGRNKIHVRNLRTGRQFSDGYDRLIITTGAAPLKLKFNGELPGNVFVLKTIDDAIILKKYMDKLDAEKKDEKNVVIIGGGFIGLELLEAFVNRGYRVNIIEKTSHILPAFEGEIIEYLENYLKDKEINIYQEDEVINLIKEKEGNALSVETIKGRTIKSDIIFLGVGTRPDTEMAKKCGIKLRKSGLIAVDRFMRTNFKNIYAAGDCCECRNLISGKSRSYNLASIAGTQGRAAGLNAIGKRKKFSGSAVNTLIKVLDLVVAKVGLGLKEAEESYNGTDFIEFHNRSHAGYYPGADMMHMIVIFSKKTGKILGFQAIGKSGVDKRADVISAALKGNLKVWELDNLDLGYHPAYGSARDPINMIGMVAGNLKIGEIVFLSVERLKEKIKRFENITILDVRTAEEYSRGHIEGAININIDELGNNADRLNAGSEIIIYCSVGPRAYHGFKILKNLGFKKVKVLNGSYLSWIRKI